MLNPQSSVDPSGNLLEEDSRSLFKTPQAKEVQLIQTRLQKALRP